MKIAKDAKRGGQRVEIRYPYDPTTGTDQDQRYLLFSQSPPDLGYDPTNVSKAAAGRMSDMPTGGSFGPGISQAVTTVHGLDPFTRNPLYRQLAQGQQQYAQPDQNAIPASRNVFADFAQQNPNAFAQYVTQLLDFLRGN